MSWIHGWKTYLAAAGLAGLALYQLSQGDYATALHTLGLAGVAAGLRHAVTTHGLPPLSDCVDDAPKEEAKPKSPGEPFWGSKAADKHKPATP